MSKSKKITRKTVSAKSKPSAKSKLSPFLRNFSLAVIALVVLTTSAWVLQAKAATVTNRAVIFGDSIFYESRAIVVAKFVPKKTWSLTTHAYPGVSLCDWLTTLQSDLVTIHPTVVVLETQGNTFTECMKDQNGNLPSYGSQAWLDKYRADLNTFVSAVSATGAKTVLVNPLPSSTTPENNSVNSLINLIKEVAGSYSKVSITSGPRNAVSKSGKFTWTKPCLASETVAMGCNAVGQIAVRNPDGLHLCPVDRSQYNFLNGCPTYSSGAARYASSLTSATVNPPAPLVP